MGDPLLLNRWKAMRAQWTRDSASLRRVAWDRDGGENIPLRDAAYQLDEATLFLEEAIKEEASAKTD